MISFKNYYSSYLLILITILIHVLFINLSPINFENSFSEGAKYLEELNYKIINNYFQHNANTYVFPFISSLIHKLVPFLETLVITKFLSATGYIFLGIGLIKLHNYYELKVNLNLLIIIIFINPLIWTFGFRGTPDFFSSSLAIFSIAFLIDDNLSIYKKVIYSLIFGLAIAIKPHAILIFLLFLFTKINFFQLNSKYLFNLFNKLLFVFIFISIPSIVYYLLCYLLFDVLFFADVYKSMHFKDHTTNENNNYYFKNYFKNLILYFSFLLLSILPLFFMTYVKAINFKKLLINLIFILLLFYLSINFSIISTIGEMDFGFLNKYIPAYLFQFIIYCSLFFSLLMIFDLIKYSKLLSGKNISLIIFILSYILLLSILRPAQRYLLFIIPFIYISYSLSYKIKLYNIIFYFFITTIINIFLLSNHVITSKSINNVINHLKSENIIFQTHPGVLNPHVRHLFFEDPYSQKNYQELLSDQKRSFIVQNFQSENSLKCFTTILLKYISKKYCINYLK